VTDRLADIFILLKAIFAVARAAGSAGSFAHPFSVYFFMAFFVPSFVLVISVLLYFLAYFAVAAAAAAILSGLSFVGPLPLAAKAAISLAAAGAAVLIFRIVRYRKPKGLIAPIGLLDASYSGRYGGKAASLGELRRAGLRVPFGYAVSGRLFDRFAERNGIELPDAIPSDPEARRAALQEIRNMIAFGRFGLGQRLRLRLVYILFIARLGIDQPIIVRSSFGGEDAPGRLAPGQYRSKVCAGSFGRFLASIRFCWCSFFTESAYLYRERMGCSQEPMLSLVVQAHLRAELLGTASAANPATGFREEFVVDISAPPEGARNVASEQSEAESIIVDTAAEYPRTPHDRRLPFLPELAAGLRELARRAENPPVVEWAVSRGKLYFLQWRPLAGLPEVKTYISAGMVEMAPEPLGPMTLSAISSIRELDSFITGPIGKYMKKKPPENILKKISGRIYADFDALNEMAASMKPSPAELAELVRLCRRAAPEANRFIESFGKQLSRLESANFAGEPVGRLLEHLKNLNSEMQGPGADCQTTCAHLAQVFSALFERTAVAAGVPADRILELSYYEKGCAASERARLIAETAEAMGGKGVAERTDELIRKYIERFWFLCPADEIELAVPRIRDNPDGFSKTIVPAPPSSRRKKKPAPTFFSLMMRNRGGNLIPWDVIFFYFLFKWTRTHATLREEIRYKLLEGWGLMRDMLLELARREPLAGELSSPEKIFCLELGELGGGAAGLGKKAGERAAEHEAEKKKIAPPVVHIDAEGRVVETAGAGGESAAGGDVFRGIAASGGVASGIAHRVEKPDDVAKVGSGEIAVVDACSPWMSVLFHQAAGVVATSGGAISHLALAAREFGLPMLVGVQGLRGADVEGRTIEINTAAGTASFKKESDSGPSD
jgi:rifampicin phosphotransferase